MADIIKRVDRNIPRNERSVNFTDADVSPGDIILIAESLGRTASDVTIESTGVMSIRLNVRQKVFQKNIYPGTSPAMVSRDIPSRGHEYDATGMALITIEAGSTYVFENTFPISSIELVSATGAFDIFCG